MLLRALHPQPSGALPASCGHGGPRKSPCQGCRRWCTCRGGSFRRGTRAVPRSTRHRAARGSDRRREGGGRGGETVDSRWPVYHFNPQPDASYGVLEARELAVGCSRSGNRVRRKQSGTISTTARALIRHAETETAPHDGAPRGTGDNRGSAGTTAPVAPGAAATPATAGSPDQFER